jgi:polar amino acid transport system permease protein
MQHVVLPQALRSMLPSLVNQLVSTLKETTLGYIIGLPELSFIATQVNNQEIVHAFGVYALLATVFFLLCFGLSRLAFTLDRRLK